MTLRKKLGLGALATAVIAAGVYAKNYTMINLMGWKWFPYVAKSLIAGLTLPSLTTVGIVASALALVAGAVYGLRGLRNMRANAAGKAPVGADATATDAANAEPKDPGFWNRVATQAANLVRSKQAGAAPAPAPAPAPQN